MSTRGADFDDDTPIPPDSWPGAAGRRSVAPPPRAVFGTPPPAGSATHRGSSAVEDSWPGAAPRSSSAPASSVATASPGTSRSRRRSGRGADGLMRPPAHRVDRRAVPMWTVAALLTVVWPVAAVVLLWIFGPADFPYRTTVAVVVGVLAIAYVAIMPTWRYRVHRWEVTPDVVYTQSGWFYQHRRVAPISRVQTVDSEFGLIARMFGLGAIKVTTASAAGPLMVDGVAREDVERVVAELTTRTAASKGDAT